MKVNRSKIDEIIKKKWIHGCPMCGGKNWTLDEKMMVTPIQLNEDRSYRFDGKILPLTPLICQNCGYTLFMNTLVVGALDDVDQAEGESDGSEK